VKGEGSFSKVCYSYFIELMPFLDPLAFNLKGIELFKSLESANYSGSNELLKDPLAYS